jgi:hypothetical protein
VKPTPIETEIRMGWSEPGWTARVSGFELGPFVVHKEAWAYGNDKVHLNKNWVVTHTQSGLSATPYGFHRLTKAKAITYAKFLLTLPIDWSKPLPSKRAITKNRPAIRAFLDELMGSAA